VPDHQLVTIGSGLPRAIGTQPGKVDTPETLVRNLHQAWLRLDRYSECSDQSWEMLAARR
jgi:hypothetical protein